MAVKLETTIKRYIGLKADRKPYTFPLESGEEKPPEGSSFLEADTGDIFRWTQDTWHGPEGPGRHEAEQAIGKQEAMRRTKDAREARFR